MLIDTHAHINFKDYKDDGDEVIKRALENDVWLINVGAEFETSQRAVEYAEKYPQGVFAAVGLHPIHLQVQKFKEGDIEFETKAEEFNYEKYKTLAHPPVGGSKVVAIGEIGLDYYRFRGSTSSMSDFPNIDDSVLRKSDIVKLKRTSDVRKLEDIKNLQKEIFSKQIELARELNKPIIIHCRNAHKDLIEILKAKTHNLKPNLRGVVHSFSGNYEQARQYRELGLKIAFNGIITFSRDYDKIILGTPLEDILVETDCPYLAPIPYRGKRNEPIYVLEIAKKLAEIKKLPLEEIIKQTTINAQKVFDIN